MGKDRTEDIRVELVFVDDRTLLAVLLPIVVLDEGGVVVWVGVVDTGGLLRRILSFSETLSASLEKSNFFL